MDSKLTRYALGWLLAAQLVVMLPQLQRLPVWVLLAWAVVGFWHWQIYEGRRGFPGTVLKTVLAMGAIGGIWWEYRNPASLEFQVGMLVAAFILKLLELKGRRDIWVVIGLGHFIICCGFLFEQLFMDMVIAVGQVTVLLMAQLALFSRPSKLLAMSGRVVLLLGAAIPLMLVLFVMFPRLDPLWSVPLPGDEARTGMSNRMSPGDISRLGRSTELAFRVEFESAVPAQHELYFRALVLEDFDGRSWRQSLIPARALRPQEASGRSWRYRVTLQPGVHEWLYGLPLSMSLRSDIALSDRYTLVPEKPISGRFRYPVQSYPDVALDVEPDTWSMRRNLALPPRLNPRARGLAADIADRYPDTAQRVSAALDYLRSRPFVYTLEPATLGENTVDEFLFDTLEGFCEHYAGSFAFLLRAAGVPARVVVGYQGGEINPLDGTLLVHQSDAHAWTEAWYPERGWVRLDPTALVAPERIDLGLEGALGQEGGYLAESLFSLRKLSGFAFANRLRYWLDSMEYGWAKWVLNYDRDQQWNLLRDIFGDLDTRYVVLFVIAAAFLPLLLVAVLTIRPRRAEPQPPLLRAYRRCLARLQQRQVMPRPGETPTDFLQRASPELAPEQAQWLESVTAAFVGGTYGGRDAEEALVQLQQLQRHSLK